MFDIKFTRSAEEDLRFLPKADQVAVLDAIEKQLPHEPTKETRNRKPLRPNDLADWELRIAGSFRVFYNVDEAKNKVEVKAVGWKEHNKLFLRGKEHEL